MFQPVTIQPEELAEDFNSSLGLYENKPGELMIDARGDCDGFFAQAILRLDEPAVQKLMQSLHQWQLLQFQRREGRASHG